MINDPSHNLSPVLAIQSGYFSFATNKELMRDIEISLKDFSIDDYDCFSCACEFMVSN